MSLQACRQKIKLCHPYYNVFPIEVTPASATNIVDAILYTLFVLNDFNGSLMSTIVSSMATWFPDYTSTEICSQITIMLKNGMLRQLPSTCQVCVNQTTPRLPRFAWNGSIDQMEQNYDHVYFLIQLAGGTRSTSTRFKYTFLPYVNPTIWPNTLAACGSW